MDRDTPLTAQQVDFKYRPVTLSAWIWLVNHGIHIGRRKKLKPIVIAEAVKLGRQLNLEEIKNLPVIQMTIEEDAKKMPRYTMDDLHKAEKELDRLNRLHENDRRIELAEDRVRYIKLFL